MEKWNHIFNKFDPINMLKNTSSKHWMYIIFKQTEYTLKSIMNQVKKKIWWGKDYPNTKTRQRHYKTRKYRPSISHEHKYRDSQ